MDSVRENGAAREVGLAYWKHSGGSEGRIRWYRTEPHYGTPSAELAVTGLNGTTAREVCCLFGAAPDMLEALYRVRNFLACSGAALANSHCMTVVEDAIERATVGAVLTERGVA